MRRFAVAIVALAGLIAVCQPASAGDEEDRLRAALKSAGSRLRELEDQNSTLDSKRAAAEHDKQVLAQKLAADEKELAALRQQTAADKSSLEQAAATQQQQAENISKWQASYNQAADTARSRDADAKQLSAVLAKMRPSLKSCEDKNAALYKIGEEVLDLYDKKDFLDIISDEPVTKLKRVELENTMQDYEDKMRANKVAGPAQ